LNLLVSSAHPAKVRLQGKLTKLLLEAGAPPNGLEDDGSPLDNALFFGYPKTARILADNGARVDKLIFAAGLGDVGRLAALLDGDPSFTDGDGYTHQDSLERALIFACLNDQVEAAAFLLDRGVDINVIREEIHGNPGTALHFAAWLGFAEMARLLIDRGADVNKRDPNIGATPFQWARRNGHSEVVTLLEEAANIEQGESLSRARKAVDSGDVATLRELLDSNPKIVSERTSDNPRTLLHTLCDSPGHRPNAHAVAQLLFDAGADVNARAPFKGKVEPGETPLHWAASNDDVEMIDVLLDAGADIDMDGGIIANSTPLHEAIVFGCLNTAAKLVERGASSNLMVAGALGRRDLAEPYFDGDGNVTPDAGALPCWPAPRPPKAALDSAFGFACRNGKLDMAQWLLSKGADINALNPVGETPLDQAISRGRHEVEAWLREVGAKTSKER
jgi:ankyrin repeat protein